MIKNVFKLSYLWIKLEVKYSMILISLMMSGQVCMYKIFYDDIL